MLLDNLVAIPRGRHLSRWPSISQGLGETIKMIKMAGRGATHGGKYQTYLAAGGRVRFAR